MVDGLIILLAMENKSVCNFGSLHEVILTELFSNWWEIRDIVNFDSACTCCGLRQFYQSAIKEVKLNSHICLLQDGYEEESMSIRRNRVHQRNFNMLLLWVDTRRLVFRHLTVFFRTNCSSYDEDSVTGINNMFYVLKTVFTAVDTMYLSNFPILLSNMTRTTVVFTSEWTNLIARMTNMTALRLIFHFLDPIYTVSPNILKQLQVLHIETNNQSDCLTHAVDYVSRNAINLQSLVIIADSRSCFDKAKITNQNFISIINNCPRLHSLILQCQEDLSESIFANIASNCPQIVTLKFCFRLTSTTVALMKNMFAKCKLLSLFELGSFAYCDFYDYTPILIYFFGNKIKTIVLNNFNNCYKYVSLFEFFVSFQSFTRISLLNLYTTGLIDIIVQHNPGLVELLFHNTENRIVRRQLTFDDLLSLSHISLLSLCDVCHSTDIIATVKPIIYVCREALLRMSIEYYWSHVHDMLSYSPPQDFVQFNVFKDEWFEPEDSFIFQLATIYQKKYEVTKAIVIADLIAKELR